MAENERRRRRRPAGALDVQDSISAELLNDISLMDANNRKTEYTRGADIGTDGIDISLAS